MGVPKALLPIGEAGESFLDRIVATLLDAGVAEVIVVVGADAKAIRSRFRPPARVQIVDNPDYERGQLTSLVAALSHIDWSAASGALVTLVDVPLVSAETIRTLLKAHRDGSGAIVRPVSNGRHGHPVIFHRRLFEELSRADPAVGAKPVVRAHAGETIEIPVQDEGAFIDIDTREDFERWIGPLPRLD
jgi:molybdenum cofactor cytidylyltransferase